MVKKKTTVKHTVGEWVANAPFITAEGVTVAQCHGNFHLLEEIANARLIAAAPDLLAACREAYDYLRQEIPGSALNRVLKDAMFKATGEKP